MSLMNRILRIDFESRSRVELSNKSKKSVGVWNYANHPSTEILMLAYKLPGSKTVELWQPRLGTMPVALRSALFDSEVTISAFNSAFERYLLQFKLHITLPASRFLDPQASARYLSMPGDLDEVSGILDLPPELAKDKRGEELIHLFCDLQVKKIKGQAPIEYWNDWNSHPKEWEEFCEYCKQDVVAEEEVSRRMEILGALPLPPFERQVWEFDQKVNDRGIPVDVDFIHKAYKLATRAKQEAKDNQNKITGLENANSTTQLLPWAQERGYPVSTLNKNTVDSVLKDPDVKLTDECRAVLKTRRETASTSYTKLAAIMRRISPDGRLRGQFIFMGSPRCGRWAGDGVQLHNLARPDKVFEEMENVIAAREMIYGEKYDEIKARFGSVLLVVKSLIRTVFVAP
jgi:DNA polymerase bacteriophage-type